MTTKTWLIFAALVVGVIGAMIFLQRGERIDLSSVDAAKVQLASAQSGEIDDKVYGNAEASVVIFEYGDYQCPGCAQVAPTIKTIVDKYKEHIGFVFRNFPIPGHPNARAAAAAVEAAGLQDGFWEMHDVVFANQSVWGSQNAQDRTSTFKEYAGNLGLDLDKFEEDMLSENVNKKINFDQAIGRKLNVTGTPTFFVNDTRVGESIGDPDEFAEKYLIPKLKEAGIELDQE